jgi:hypothetical protein
MDFTLFPSVNEIVFFQCQKNNKFDVAVRDVTIFYSTQKSSQGADIASGLSSRLLVLSSRISYKHRNISEVWYKLFPI